MHRVRAKICGIKSLEIAEFAVEHGADALGFVFCEKSARNIGIRDAAYIIANLPSFVNKVGVFVGNDILEMTAIAAGTGIDTIQLHGEASAVNMRFIKELREKTGLTIILAVRTETLDDETLKGISGSERVMKGWINNYIVDRYDEKEAGGTGKTVGLRASDFGDPVIKDFIRRKIILAGGLNSSNILDILKQIEPYGVDVSSGVESEKGVKDKNLIRDFLDKIMKWNAERFLNSENKQ